MTMIPMQNALIALVFAILITAILTWVLANNYKRRETPTAQERIDAVLRASTPATHDDLMRLIAEGCVYTMDRLASRSTYREQAYLSWQFRLQLGDTIVRTPERNSLVELLQDVPSFEAQVQALKISRENT